MMMQSKPVTRQYGSIPNLAAPWSNKGEALVDQGKYDEAITACNEAIRLDPNYAKAWSIKGLALEALGRTTEADAAFARAEELEQLNSGS